jgi:ATP-binding cassette subfamily B protein
MMEKTIKKKEKRVDLKKDLNTYKKVFKYIGEYKKDTFWTWATVLMETICEVLVAFFMKNIVDGINASDLNSVILYSVIVACLALTAAIVGIIAGYWAASASSGFGKNLRMAMYTNIQDYSFKNIDKFSTSSIVTRTTTDVTNVQNAFQQGIRAVVRAPFLMVFSLIMCFFTEWKLAWIFLVIIPVVLFGLLFIASFVHPTFVKVFNKYDELNQNVQENVDGIRVVKGFNREGLEEKKFNVISDFVYRNFSKAEKILAFNSPLLNGAIYLAMILIAYIGAVIIVQSGGSELGTGGLTTLITYVMMIFNSLMMISMVYVMIIIARNSAERINEILDEKPDIVSPKNAVKEIKNGEVIFDHVDFGYSDGKNVLKDINIPIKSGSNVGIIGSTGSGKTSLVSLIARLYDATSGKVMVGGVDVKDYDVEALRNSVAVVLQKNTLFSGTIRSNLLWGNEGASDEEIMKACDLAEASSFIRSFKDGLDTEIDEGGTNVSGGQKQRLCIARALLKNPKILILDDSTSACDTHTDSLIRKSLASYLPSVTKIIIAQRVLSIKDCDLILVMNEGEIVASGNNDSLMESSAVYKSLYDSQLGGGGDFDARN